MQIAPHHRKVFRVLIDAEVMDYFLLQVCPSLLIKKDRGRPTGTNPKPKAFGEVHVDSNIPGVELLEESEGNSDEDIDGESCDELEDDNLEDDGVDLVEEDGSGADSECESDSGDSDCDEIAEDDEMSDENDNDCSDDEEESGVNSDENEESISKLESKKRKSDFEGQLSESKKRKVSGFGGQLSESKKRKSSEFEGQPSESKKRKFSDFEEQLSAANQSLRALKKLAGTTQNESLDTTDGILSNEDFQRIKELKVCIFVLLYIERVMFEGSCFLIFNI